MLVAASVTVSLTATGCGGSTASTTAPENTAPTEQMTPEQLAHEQSLSKGGGR